MSDPRPLRDLLDAALTPELRQRADDASDATEIRYRHETTLSNWTAKESQYLGCLAWRAVLTSALLAALEDDTLARVAEFRAMIAQSGEDRVRASLILKTFDDLFLEDTPHGVHVDSEPSDPVRED